MQGIGLGRRGFLGWAASWFTGGVPTTPDPGVLTSFLTPEPQSLHPFADVTPSAGLVVGKIFQGLTRFSDELAPLPELARKWVIDQGGRRCIFYVRRDVRFHDGTLLTARDVAASIRQRAAQSPLPGFGWFKAEAPDDEMLVLSSDWPVDQLLPLFDGTSCPVMPEHGMDTSLPVGTGPFRLDSWDKGHVIRLRRAAQYWRAGQPMLAGLDYRIVPDAAERLRMMQAGEAQLAQLYDLPPAQLASLRRAGAMKFSDRGWEYHRPLCRLDLNRRVVALRDARVRQAIDLAVDRNDIVDRVWGGFARIAGGPLPQAFSVTHPSVPTRDPRAASALLSQVGLQPNEQGVRLSLELLVPGWAAIGPIVAQSLSNALRQVGIDLRPLTVDAAEWSRRLAAFDYDSALVSAVQNGCALHGLMRDYHSANQRHIAGANTAGYADEETDSALEAARAAPDAASRAQAIGRAEARLVQNFAQIWLFEPFFPTVSSGKLHNATAFGAGVFAPFDYVFLH